MSNILDYYSIDPTSFRYISHHGILGQKWGVRRYQNKDGTLTEAGKKRAAKDIIDANKKVQRLIDSKVGNKNEEFIATAIHKNAKIYEEERKAREALNEFETDFKKNNRLIKKHLEYSYFYDGVPLDYIIGMPDEKFNFNRDLPKMIKDSTCINCAYENYCHGRHNLKDTAAENAQKKYEDLYTNLIKAESASFKANQELGKSLIGDNEFMQTKVGAVGTVTNIAINRASRKYRGY